MPDVDAHVVQYCFVDVRYLKLADLHVVFRYAILERRPSIHAFGKAVKYHYIPIENRHCAFVKTHMRLHRHSCLANAKVLTAEFVAVRTLVVFV